MYIFYGVGVGPGDPEWMTLKAVRIIQKCNVIAVPDSGAGESVALRIAAQVIPDITEKEILYLSMPMTRDAAVLDEAHQAATQTILQYLQKEDVAFLTLGDVSVYSTYAYLQKRVEAEGMKTEMIPGVPSFCAAAAALNIPLVEGEEMLHLVPSLPTASTAMQMKGTRIFMKAGKNFGKIKALLTTAEQVHMVERCGMPDEIVYPAGIELPQEAGYFSLVIAKKK